MVKYFIIKHKYNEIPQHSLVEYITCINTMCLVEEYHTKNREWVCRYDIYPLKDHYLYGPWTYNESYQNLIPAHYFDLIKK